MKPRVVVLGMMGRTPFAGVAWQVLHYVEGLRRTGAEVSYLEDTGAWPYDPIENTVTDNPAYTVEYLARMLERVDVEHWSYVAPDGAAHGPASPADLLREADALVNLTGATVLREEHLAVPVRIYLETDPVAPQVEVALGKRFTIDLLAAHTHHFSFGENLGSADCLVPVEGPFTYRATRQPVVLEWWSAAGSSANGSFTTVASWSQPERDVLWQGETYLWSKGPEFTKVVELPRRLDVRLELALACDDEEALAMLSEHGWSIVDALPLSTGLEPYREYVLGSRGEFTVAKDQNVRLRSGWFSDRSACYLAAGKPVVTQDTGFGAVLPTREGLFAFTTVDEAAEALAEIESDYERHAATARRIAEEHFEAEAVCRRLLSEAGAL